MKAYKIITCVVATAVLMTVTAFGATETSNTSKEQTEFHKQLSVKESEDPVKLLEERKSNIQKKLKDGKISKEKADEITAKIDARIKEINDFNKLTLKQKKDKLTADFKAKMEKKVSEGKLTRQEADERIAKFNKKIEKWDGKGYPQFFKKHSHQRQGKEGCHKEKAKGAA